MHRDVVMCVVLNCFSHVQLFAVLWTVARQAPLSMGFSRQKYWSRLPFLSLSMHKSKSFPDTVLELVEESSKVAGCKIGVAVSYTSSNLDAHRRVKGSGGCGHTRWNTNWPQKGTHLSRF